MLWRFNEAAAMKPRKFLCKLINGNAYVLLQ